MEKRMKWMLNMLVVSAVIFVVLSGVASATNLIQLPQTGQTKCYDASGIEIPCEGTGQDGDSPKGALWPSPRFNINGDGTLTDKLTGLVWLKDGNCFGSQSWTSALDKIADFNAHPENYACQDYVSISYTWRLPNINELNSLIDTGEPYPDGWLVSQGFTNVQYDWYWSSTTDKAYPLSAWTMSMMVGWINEGQDKATGQLYVWPVAKGQSGTPDPNYPANVRQTGQKIVYYPGDDGSIQAGVKDPTGRFNDNSDGTITDTLTGLIWLKDTSSPIVGSCSIGTMGWQEALDYAKCLNSISYLSHTDWRVPNRAEFQSLMDYSESNPALPSGHPFINLQTNLPNYRFWTSTTVTNPNYGNTVAWQGDITSGALGGSWKGNEMSYPYLAWLVRGESGVVIPPNQNPNKPTGLGQLRSDGITAITAGDKTNERTVVFKATVEDPDNDQVKLEIELRRNSEYDNKFDENQPGIKESELVPSGSQATIMVNDLTDSGYHWRTRAVDGKGNKGDWQDYGDNDISAADFVVSVPPTLPIPPDSHRIKVLNENDQPLEGATIRMSYSEKANKATDKTTYGLPLVKADNTPAKTNKEGVVDIFFKDQKERDNIVIRAWRDKRKDGKDNRPWSTCISVKETETSILWECQLPLDGPQIMATKSTTVDTNADKKDGTPAYARLGWTTIANDPRCTFVAKDKTCYTDKDLLDLRDDFRSNLHTTLKPFRIERYKADYTDDLAALGYLKEVASKYQIPLPVLEAVVSAEAQCQWTKSGSCGKAQWDNDGWTKITFDGGIGAMQLTGGTALTWATDKTIDVSPDKGTDSLSASFKNNIKAGAGRLNSAFQGNNKEIVSNWECALGEYNAGPKGYCNNPKYVKGIKGQYVRFYPDESRGNGWYIEDDSLKPNKKDVTLETLWKATCGIQEVNGKNLWVCQKIKT